MKAFQKVFNPFFSEEGKQKNKASKGACDILVIQHDNGQVYSTPFLVYYGSKYHQQAVKIIVNQQPIDNVYFIVDETGYIQPNQIPRKSMHQLMLSYGKNKVAFVAQNNKTIQCEIYYFSAYQKFLVSDIDGTMTKTDLGGIICNLNNENYCHKGYEDLMEKAQNNGYKIIFLTMRPFVLYQFTKHYLRTHTNVEGALIVQNSWLTSSIAKQILQMGAKYKQRQLIVIRELFPKHINPFFAGLGNKKGDATVYQKMGIPDERIFIINKQSQISQLNGTMINYQHIGQNIAKYFPKQFFSYGEWQEKMSDLKKTFKHHFEK